MKNSIALTLGILCGFAVGNITLNAANTLINVYKNNEVRVSVDGSIQVFRDETTGELEYPITYKDRTYLPLRSVANLVGLLVDYDADTNTAMLETSEYEKKRNKVYYDFKNQCDSISMKIINDFSDVYVEYALNGMRMESEEIYYMLVTGINPVENEIKINDYEKIDIDYFEKKYGIEVSKKIANRNEWYITKKGVIFNLEGCYNNGKTYYNSDIYMIGKNTKYNKEELAQKIVSAIENDIDEIK